MPKTKSAATLAGELLQELVDLDSSHEQNPTSEKLPKLMKRLQALGLLAPIGTRQGTYVLRDPAHGSPVILHGFELRFLNLDFARLCRDAYSVHHTAVKKPQILQIIE